MAQSLIVDLDGALTTVTFAVDTELDVSLDKMTRLARGAHGGSGSARKKYAHEAC